MLPRPPGSTRSNTICPYSTLFRSALPPAGPKPISSQSTAHPSPGFLKYKNHILISQKRQGITSPETQNRGDATCRAESERQALRSEEHTSELQSLMRTSYAVFCLNKKIYSKFDAYTAS